MNLFLRRPPHQKPIPNRFRSSPPRHTPLLLIILLFFSLPGPSAWAQTPPPPSHNAQEFTESDFLRHALERPELLQYWEARQTEAEARIKIESPFTNPSLNYSREHLFEPSPGAEDSLSLEFLLPLSGRQRLQQDAARRDARAEEFHSQTELIEIATALRADFYELLFLQETVAIHQETFIRLNDTIHTLSLRVEGGESSLYELERLRRESAEIVAAIEETRAALDLQKALLARWVRADASGELLATGHLLPTSVPTDEEIIASVAALPGLLAISESLQALEFRRQSASRWWIPDLLLEGGIKTEALPTGRAFGYLLGASASLPLFSSRGRAEEALLQARIDQTSFQQRLQAESLQAQALGVARQTRRLQEAARAYHEDSFLRARRILTLAEQSYQAGEASILELLDAHQGVAHAALRHAELTFQARRTYLELQRLLGDLPSPANE